MKTIIPFTKEIKLDSKVAEITSISLEHEMHINPDGLAGDFIISGDYRAHEISINREPFSYRLPFSVDLGDSINRNSVDFEIVDFTYDLDDEDILKVNIEFSVEADENLEEEEEEDMEVVEEDRLENDLFETVEEVESVEEMIEEQENRLDPEMENTIMNSALNGEDTYTTYHVHIVKESETIESICASYNIGIDVIKNYNDVDEVLVGDKIIIPDEVND